MENPFRRHYILVIIENIDQSRYEDLKSYVDDNLASVRERHEPEHTIAGELSDKNPQELTRKLDKVTNELIAFNCEVRVTGMYSRPIASFAIEAPLRDFTKNMFVESIVAITVAAASSIYILTYHTQIHPVVVVIIDASIATVINNCLKKLKIRYL